MEWESTIGEVQELQKTEYVFEWKIRDFFSIFEEDGKSYKSPTFNFEEPWCLQMYPKRFTGCEFIDVRLCRELSGPPKNLLWSVALKTKDGAKDYEEQCSDFFEGTKDNDIRGVIIVRRSVVLDKKFLLVPSDILTVVCTFYCCSKCADNNVSESIEHPLILPVNKVSQDFKELFLSQEYSDVTLKVKERKFRAHKAILYARSSVFACTFSHDMKEKASGTVDIKDCDPDDFRNFLCFLYCGCVENISTENVFGLFTVADKYDVQELRSLCLGFIKTNLSVNTFCDTLSLALQHSEKELMDLSADFLTRHIKEVIVTPKWQSFLLENAIAVNEILVKALTCNKR